MFSGLITIKVKSAGSVQRRAITSFSVFSCQIPEARHTEEIQAQNSRDEKDPQP